MNERKGEGNIVYESPIAVQPPCGGKIRVVGCMVLPAFAILRNRVRLRLPLSARIVQYITVCNT